MPLRRLESPSPHEVARRVRAAFAYAGLDATKPVRGLRIDPPTIQQIVDPDVPRGAESEDELHQIAEATGVPVGFLLDGFMLEQHSHSRATAAPAGVEHSLQHSVAALARELSELRSRLDSGADPISGT